MADLSPTNIFDLLIHVFPSGTVIVLAAAVVCLAVYRPRDCRRLFDVILLKLEHLRSYKDVVEFSDSPDASVQKKDTAAGPPRAAAAFSPNTPQLPRCYIDHETRPSSSPTYFQQRIFLNADHWSDLEKVKAVTWYLHESYRPDDVRRVEKMGSRDYPFLLEVFAWGESCVVARIEMQDGSVETQARYLSMAKRIRRQGPEEG